MQREFRINVPISKIDEEKRMVWGIATSEMVDSQGDVVDYEASKAAFPNWLGNIREMHEPIAVGKNMETTFDDDTKQVMIGAYISESADGENTWIKVKEGILQGFSIGGSVNKVKKEVAKNSAGDEVPVTRIVDYSLSEVSLVDNPANPEAMFVMVKSANGGLQRVEEVVSKADIKKEFRLPAWHTQFMIPIEKAQALYDNSMKKSGVAVVDGDARDAKAASVTPVVAATPVKAGTTVPKKVYGADGVSTTNKAQGADMKKGMWDASFLLDLAIELSYYIQMEEYEGESVDDLNAALATIKDAVVKELTEPTVELTTSVELAQKLSNLKKGKTMSTDVKKSTAVAGGEERNENAEVVTSAEENGRPVNDTTERAAEAGVPVAGEPVVDKDGEAVLNEDGTPKVQEAVTEAPKDEPKKEEVKAGVEADKGTETPAADAKSEPSAEEAAVNAKAVTVGDLKKFSDGLIAKLGDSSKEELSKMVGELTDTVTKSMTTLEGRISKLEDQPAPSKGKASFATITKGEDGAADEDAELQTVLKRRDELAANPNLGTPEERFEITKSLRKFQAAGHKLSK